MADLALELKKRRDDFEVAKDRLKTAEANAAVADKQLQEIAKAAKAEFGVDTLEQLQDKIKTKETEVQEALGKVEAILKSVK